MAIKFDELLEALNIDEAVNASNEPTDETILYFKETQAKHNISDKDIIDTIIRYFTNDELIDIIHDIEEYMNR